MANQGPINTSTPGPGKSEPKDIDKVDQPKAAAKTTAEAPTADTRRVDNAPAPGEAKTVGSTLQPAHIAPEDVEKTGRLGAPQGLSPIEPRADVGRTPARVPPVGAEGASSSGQTQGGEGRAPHPNRPYKARRPLRHFGLGPETLNTREAQEARMRFDAGEEDEKVVATDAKVVIKK